MDFGPVHNNPGCGIDTRRNIAQRRIVGGDEAGFGSFPWQAYIRIGTSRCGGSLVNEWYVVTAGHCVKNKNLSKVLVTMGEYHLKKAEPLPSQSFRVARAVVHPKFKFSPAADRSVSATLKPDYLPLNNFTSSFDLLPFPGQQPLIQLCLFSECSFFLAVP